MHYLTNAQPLLWEPSFVHTFSNADICQSNRIVFYVLLFPRNLASCRIVRLSSISLRYKLGSGNLWSNYIKLIIVDGLFKSCVCPTPPPTRSRGDSDTNGVDDAVVASNVDGVVENGPKYSPRMDASSTKSLRNLRV
jgi:hypothetical protein